MLDSVTLMLILVLIFAVVFDFINGFHDTANAIATVVSTRVLSPNLAILIEAASRFGFPLSTTHIISSTILGVGSAKHFKSVRWIIVRGMIQAWIFTIPATAFIAFISYIILTKIL